MNDTDLLIAGLPKAELHMHLEGSLEPQMVFDIAARNRLDLSFASVDELRAAYGFANLQQFLDLYYQNMSVLREERDFHDLTLAYLNRCAQDNVRHVEVFFDPQGHTVRGVAFETVVRGIVSGLSEGRARYGISSALIMCFLRHLSEDDGFETLAAAEPWLEHLTGVGLDSSERGHPPGKFKNLFASCRERGLKLCMHAGEEGPADYVHAAVCDIGVDRIDHGNSALDDPALVAEIRHRELTLTVCPLSNLALKVIPAMAYSPVRAMLEANLSVCVNSDDPAYFGGYVNDNFRAAAEGLSLSPHQLVTLARNSFLGSFLPDETISAHLTEIDAVADRFGVSA